MSKHLFATIAQELPTLIAQLESGDPTLRAVAVMRLKDFAQMLAPWRGALGKQTSRRGLLRAGATFAALSFRDDD
jgi:hypothetical protein